MEGSREGVTEGRDVGVGVGPADGVLDGAVVVGEWETEGTGVGVNEISNS